MPRLGRARRIKPVLLKGLLTSKPTKRILVELNTASSRLARLGRARREKPRILRAPSVPTPTPLVRKRVLVEQDSAPARLNRVGRAIRRGALTIKPPLPQPPPAYFRPKVYWKKRVRLLPRDHTRFTARPSSLPPPTPQRPKPVRGYHRRGVQRFDRHPAVLVRSHARVVSPVGPQTIYMEGWRRGVNSPEAAVGVSNFEADRGVAEGVE